MPKQPHKQIQKDLAIHLKVDDIKAITIVFPLMVNLSVCAKYFFLTLDKNHKRVQLFHKNAETVCGTPAGLKRGDSVNLLISEEIKNDISAHVE